MRKLTEKAVIFVVFLLFVTVNCSGKVITPAEPKIIDTCGKGVLLDVGGQRVLLLAGNHYEMGFQQGKLLKSEAERLVSTILTVVNVAQAAGAKGFFNGSINDSWARSQGFIDKRFHDEMRGLADGAGLSLKDVQLANIFPELFHCSGFALFGDATRDGTLYHGRILDYMTEIGLQDYAVLTIAKPQGYNSFVTMGYAGFIGSVTGMNSSQIAIGEMGGKGEGDWDGMPMSFLLRKALEEASTLQEAVDIFQNTARTCEYYYVISDAKIPDARGIAATPKKLDVIKPNVEYKLLPHPVKDAVLLSAGDRYEALVSLVKENYGKIDADKALELMDRPVAMKSCLHRVLFEPAKLELWVSNAVSPLQTEEYAAYAQPYYHYKVKELVAILDGRSATNDEIKDTGAKPQEKSAVKAEVQEITGIVSGDTKRECRPSADPQQQKMIDKYYAAPQQFAYGMTPMLTTSAYQVYQVSFPSPYKSPVEQNNTVYGEYYESAIGGTGKKPAVILLDILDGSMVVSRIMANGLAYKGINSCIMSMPYYGKRRPEGDLFKKSISADINLFMASVEQAVMDVRRTAVWLDSMEGIDGDNIGICGTSLGGFIAALSAGVDGNFGSAAFVLAGGDLAAVLTTNEPEVRLIKKYLKDNNISDEVLGQLIKQIEPLNYADRLQNTKVLMINGSKDKIVPPLCAEKLAQKANVQIDWYDTDHYGMAKYMLTIIDKLGKHFTPQAETAGVAKK